MLTCFAATLNSQYKNPNTKQDEYDWPEVSPEFYRSSQCHTPYENDKQTHDKQT